ncbi:MAG: metallophosphoesterase family protein [Planctomycetota bacterium]|jgi:predicted phosphodiesterase
MKYGIFGDIHGNFEALEAVVEQLKSHGVEKFICVGDIVGYGANPVECVNLVRELCSVVVAGNHDFATIEKLNIDFFNSYAREAVVWTRKQISQEHTDYLAGLNLVEKIEDEMTVVHGSLNFPEMFDYIQTSYDAHLSLQSLDTQICFLGHSHVPVSFFQKKTVSYSMESEFKLEEGQNALVNVGSVGQPRDENPEACYAVYDSDEKLILVLRTPYDIDLAGRKILEAGLPEILAERLRYGR